MSRRRSVPSVGPLPAVTAVAVCVCTVVATVLVLLDVDAGGVAAHVTTVFQVISAALFLGAGVLRVARFRIAGDQRSLRMGVAIVVFGGIALPLTSLAGVMAAGEDQGSMLRAATAMVTTGVVQLVVLHAVTGRDHPRPDALRLLLTACGSAVLLFLGLVALHAWAPTVLHAETVPPTTLRGTLLAVTWLYVGLEAALRSEERPWAGKLAPLLGCMGVAEVLRVVSVYRTGGWELAAAALVACLAAISAHRALVDLDEATTRERAGAAAQPAGREELVHDARNAIAGPRAALVTLETYGGVLDAATSDRLRSAALGGINHLEHLIVRPDQTEAADFDLAEVVSNVVESQRANGADIDLAVAPLPVRGRPGDLATALQNLLVNARDHGGNRITVRAARVGDRVEVLVSDRGPGLSDSELTTLFQRGARGPASTGSGLGLHVSRTLMRQQGGDLELRDHHGGATFVLVVASAEPAPGSVVRLRPAAVAAQVRRAQPAALAGLDAL